MVRHSEQTRQREQSCIAEKNGLAQPELDSKWQTALLRIAGRFAIW